MRPVVRHMLSLEIPRDLFAGTTLRDDARSNGLVSYSASDRASSVHSPDINERLRLIYEQLSGWRHVMSACHQLVSAGRWVRADRGAIDNTMGKSR